MSTWKRWQQRYFILTAETLSYFSKKEGTLRFAIPLDEIISVAHIISKCEIKCGFKTGEIYFLKAANDKDAEMWTAALKKGIEDKASVGNTATNKPLAITEVDAAVHTNNAGGSVVSDEAKVNTSNDMKENTTPATVNNTTITLGSTSPVTATSTPGTSAYIVTIVVEK